MTTLVGKCADQLAPWLERDRDDWTRHVLARHFDPEHGSEFWLARKSKLGLDPRDITRYEQLAELGRFPLEELRNHDPASMVPRSTPRPLRGRVWESGGTTGAPSRVFYTEPMLRNLSVWLRWALASNGFEPDRTWLHAVPTGPHIIGNSARELIDGFAGLVYGIDLDPRWVKWLLREGRGQDVRDYQDHLCRQISDVLSDQPVDYLFTTPALLNTLVAKYPDLVAGLEGVQLGGTQLTSEMYRTFSAALGGGPVGYVYGNTLGCGYGVLAECDGDTMPCFAIPPIVNHDIVNIDDNVRPVGYGERGRVRLTILDEDLLLPNVLERDSAVRYDTGPDWPADGVANVAPLRPNRQTREGIY